MTTQIRLLGPNDADVLARVAPNVFDRPLDPALCEEFLHDPRHHLAVALVEGIVVGFASAVHYIHPDKPAELWINEVGVAEPHRREGIAKELMRVLLDRGRELGCREAWVLTNPDNAPAMRLYTSCGGREAEEPTVMFNFSLE